MIRVSKMNAMVWAFLEKGGFIFSVRSQNCLSALPAEEVQVEILYECNDYGGNKLINAVRIGEGISLLCEKQVSAFKLDEVALLRLDCPVVANVVIASRIKPPEHIRSFIKYLKTQSGIES